MESDAPDGLTLERLVTSEDIRDRAFAASVLSLHRDLDPAEVTRLYERIRATAAAAHAEVRERIRSKTLDRARFVAQLREAPLETRDHLVEEIFDIAYPPLLEHSLPREMVHYAPSGLAEILFAIERSGLGPTHTFVDLGAGRGKVVLLVALLTGARACGVEIDPALAARARAAARSLALDRVELVEADIREAPLPPADVYYMYIPLTRSVDLVARLAAVATRQKIVLFSQTLDATHVPWLRWSNASCYWLEMYESV